MVINITPELRVSSTYLLSSSGGSAAISCCMAVSGQVPEELDHALFLGELSLDGTVRHVNGVLPMAHLARELGYRSVFVPQSDAPEAALIEGIDVYPVPTLGGLAAHLRDYHPIEPYRATLDLDAAPPAYAADFMDIKGQMSTPS